MPTIFISDQGTHFVNQLTDKLTEVFLIQHQKTNPYQPLENGVVKSFNKILENSLQNIFNVQKDKWDQRITMVLCAYRTTCKMLTHDKLHLDWFIDKSLPCH